MDYLFYQCVVFVSLQVEVHSIENVQGREFRALFLSTVRTCSNEPLSDEDGGFLTNAKVGGANVSHDLSAPSCHMTSMHPQVT